MLFPFYLMFTSSAFSQGAAINTTWASADPWAILYVSNTTAPYQGMLIPRVAISGTTEVATILNPANCLLIKNTATAGTSPNTITPGFYYYDATTDRWIQYSTDSTFVDPTNLNINIGR